MDTPDAVEPPAVTPAAAPHARLTVTLSAAYGAGGSVVGPALGDRLGVPFLDRAIPAAVAADLRIDVATALAREGRVHTVARGLMTGIAALPNLTLGGLGGFAPVDQLVDPRDLAEETASVLLRVADTTGGVVLGRAAAVVLAGRPGVLHVRLTGSPKARQAQACRLHACDGKTAASLQAHHDAARENYVRRLYGRDPNDPALYDLILDSTRIPLDRCVEMIAIAAEALRSSA